MPPHNSRQVVSFFHRSPAQQNHPTLTECGWQVTDLLARGAMHQEVAHEQVNTKETICSHIKKIYDKLHAHSRTEPFRKYRGE